MGFFNNGIVIQDLDYEWPQFTRKIANEISSGSNSENRLESERLSSYYGFDRYLTWPLEFEKDEKSKTLTEEANKKWLWVNLCKQYDNFIPEVVPDIDYCSRYISHCLKKGIRIRIIFCQSNSKFPVWNSNIPQLKFLGHEYSNSNLQSQVPEDLLANPFEKYSEHPLYKQMRDCANSLNNFKLFKTEKEAEVFEESRKAIIQSDIEWETVIVNGVPGKAHLVEDDGAFFVIKISEVVGYLL